MEHQPDMSIQASHWVLYTVDEYSLSNVALQWRGLYIVNTTGRTGHFRSSPCLPLICASGLSRRYEVVLTVYKR